MAHGHKHLDTIFNLDLTFAKTIHCSWEYDINPKVKPEPDFAY